MYFPTHSPFLYYWWSSWLAYSLKFNLCNLSRALNEFDQLKESTFLWFLRLSGTWKNGIAAADNRNATNVLRLGMLQIIKTASCLARRWRVGKIYTHTHTTSWALHWNQKLAPSSQKTVVHSLLFHKLYIIKLDSVCAWPELWTWFDSDFLITCLSCTTMRIAPTCYASPCTFIQKVLLEILL